MKPRLLACALLALLARPAIAANPATFAEAANYVRSPQGSFGGFSLLDLQVTYRLAGVLGRLHYQCRPDDLGPWKMLLENPAETIYARLCAAYFLVETEPEARLFLEQTLQSANLRHRYNAAKILVLVSGHESTPEAKSWELDLMIRHLADGSLDQTPIQQPDGIFPEGDAYDIDGSPVGEFCYRFATLKVKDAAPAILAYLQRPPKKNPLILDVLGDLGDPQAIPYLLQVLQSDNEGAYALGKLKAREAVPILLAKLTENDDPTIHYFQGPDDVILRALRDIGDARAIAPIRHYLRADRAKENIATARRVLIELSATDPAKDLIRLFGKESIEAARGDIVADLAESYPEPRTVTLLASIGATSGSAYLRARAIAGLGQIGSKASLTALAQLLDRPFPKKLTTNAGFKDAPKDFTVYFHDLVAQQLRDATHQDFGQDSSQWKSWIASAKLP